MIGVGDVWNRFLSMFGASTSDDYETPIRNPLAYPPVWYAVNKIAGIIGYLPLDIRKQDGRNIDKDLGHPSYRIWRWRPNPNQTPIQLKRSMVADGLLWGNGCAYIERDSQRRPKALYPMYAGNILPDMKDGRKIYKYYIDLDDPIGKAKPDLQGQYIEFRDDEIFHLPGLGSNGYWGYSVIGLAKDSWEAGLGGIRRLKTLSKKGYHGGLMLKAPVGAFARNATDANKFLEEFKANHSGEDKSGVIGMLREGIDAQVIQMSNVDAQFIETMRHLRQDEALRFMLESILGDDSSVSYSSLEQKNLAFLQNCLNTWLCAFEEECDVKLLTEVEQQSGYFHKFNVGALLRSDTETTMRSVSMGITSRVLSPNEAREMLDRNPYEGGDEYLNPAIEQATRSGQPDTEPSRQPQNALKTQIEHMIAIESKRVVDYAKKSKNFTDAIETFYAGWETRLADQVEKLGGDRQAAQLHCNESKGQLMAICDRVTQDRLLSDVQSLVDTWVARSDQFITDMELLNV